MLKNWQELSKLGKRGVRVKELQEWAAAGMSVEPERRWSPLRSSSDPAGGLGMEESGCRRFGQVQVTRSSPSRCFLLLILGDSLPCLVGFTPG